MDELSEEVTGGYFLLARPVQLFFLMANAYLFCGIFLYRRPISSAQVSIL